MFSSLFSFPTSSSNTFVRKPSALSSINFFSETSLSLILELSSPSPKFCSVDRIELSVLVSEHGRISQKPVDATTLSSSVLFVMYNETSSEALNNLLSALNNSSHPAKHFRFPPSSNNFSPLEFITFK